MQRPVRYYSILKVLLAKCTAQTTPHMYIIDPEGTLRYNGAIDSIKSANPVDIPKAVNYVLSGFTEINAGADITNKTTVPYGCSIKYKS